MGTPTGSLDRTDVGVKLLSYVRHMSDTHALTTMTYEVTGRIARITLNRPARGNGITIDLPRELAACVERANLDARVHVIALAGNGKGFCGGYDLAASAEGNMDGMTAASEL